MASQGSANGRHNGRMARLRGVVGGVVVAGATVLALAACAPGEAAPTAPATPRASSTPVPEPTAEPALLIPEGSAAENLPYFDQLAAGVLAADPAAGGEAFVNALVAGGFDKAAMEVGFDRTSVDLAADSVQWSVRFNDGCMIGQFGPASGGYHSIATPVLSTGTCLIGTTRPIDW